MLAEDDAALEDVVRNAELKQHKNKNHGSELILLGEKQLDRNCHPFT